MFFHINKKTMGEKLHYLPKNQPKEDARLARWQRIVPLEECCMQKFSRSAAESVSVSVRCKNVVPGFSQLQGWNYSTHCTFSQSGGVLHLDLFRQFVFSLCLMWKGHCGMGVFILLLSSFNCEQFHSLRTYRTSELELIIRILRDTEC